MGPEIIYRPLYGRRLIAANLPRMELPRTLNKSSQAISIQIFHTRM